MEGAISAVGRGRLTASGYSRRTACGETLSAFEPRPGDQEQEPYKGAVDALADLAGLARGGGRPGANADQLAEDFAVNLSRSMDGQRLVLDVRDDGLFADGKPLWAHDLLARRVAICLRDQGLRAVAVEGDAPAKTLRGLAMILARDWKTEDTGALSALFDGRDLQGLSLDFSEGGPATEPGQVDPRATLEIIRAQGGDTHPQVAAMLDRVRTALGGAPDLGDAVRGAGSAARDRFAREIAVIDAGEDISVDTVSRVLFEAMRLDPAGLQASDTFRLVMDHYEHLLAAGHPRDALDLVRRPLALLDAGLHPDWKHRELVEAELVLLYDPNTLARMVDAANADGDQTAWRELLFTLGRVAPDGARPTLCSAGGQLTSAELRQAIADGLVASSDKPQEVFALLLARVADQGLAVVLLGLSRLEAPALLEKILSRVDNEYAVVRGAALVALRKHRTPHTQEVVRRAIADADEAVRIEALRYVSVYRDSDAAPIILDRLKGPSAATASSAELKALAMSLALIQRDAAVDSLADVAVRAGSDRPKVARAAVGALRSLGDVGRPALTRLMTEHPELARVGQAPRTGGTA